MKRLLAGFGLAAALSILAAQTVLAWPDDTQAQLSSSPSGIAPGDTWSVDLSFVSGGRALALNSFRPIVVIREAATGETHTFVARSSGSPGIYHADVVFPSAGTWSYRVAPTSSGPYFDYPVISIVAPPAAESPSPALPLATLLALGVVGVILAASARTLLARGAPTANRAGAGR